MGLIKKYELGRVEVAFIVIILVAVVVAGAYAFKVSRDQKNAEGKIDSFQACVDAGNPVAESFPEQCSADGQTFTNPNQVVSDGMSQPTEEQLELKEWGLKFSLTGEMTRATYRMKDDDKTAVLSHPSADDTDCSLAKSGIVEIRKRTSKELGIDDQGNAPEDLDMTEVTSINNFYYQLIPTKANCAESLRDQFVMWLPDSLKLIDANSSYKPEDFNE